MCDRDKRVETVRRRLRGGGFTLVEALVLGVIVTLAAALVLPAAWHARDTAKLVTCQANLKLLGVAHHMYADMQKESFPTYRRQGTKIGWHHNPLFRSLMHVGPEYTGAYFPERLLCPERPCEKGKTTQFRLISRSYGSNGSNVPVVTEPDGEAQYIRRTDIHDPSQKVQVLDANDWRTNMTGADYTKKWDVSGEATNTDGGAFQVVAYRHEQTVNAIHFDGSVRNYQKSELWIRKPDGKSDQVATRKKWWVVGDETVAPPPKDPAKAKAKKDGKKKAAPAADAKPAAPEAKP